MRASYEHKFAKKPEVIDGNMKALEMAYMVVENRDNGVVELGRGELISSEDKDSFGNSPTRVDIHYCNTQLKATHMYIVFVSSTAAEPSVGLSNGGLGAFDGYSDSRYVGNVLTVDNVELIYE